MGPLPEAPGALPPPARLMKVRVVSCGSLPIVLRDDVDNFACESYNNCTCLHMIGLPGVLLFSERFSDCPLALRMSFLALGTLFQDVDRCLSVECAAVGASFLGTLVQHVVVSH